MADSESDGVEESQGFGGMRIMPLEARFHFHQFGPRDKALKDSSEYCVMIVVADTIVEEDIGQLSRMNKHAHGEDQQPIQQCC